MSQNDKLGKLTEGEEGRDAIHIAICPVVANEVLNPGQRIGFVRDGDVSLVGKSKNPLGIVDPFLTANVEKAEAFFMCLFPNTIKSLRHEWTHDAFENADALKVLKGMQRLDNSESIAFLSRYARKVELSYEKLIEAANNYLENGDDVCLDFDTPDMVYQQRKEFWEHFSRVTGVEVPEEKNKETFFSCAC
jgi:hypothetical protein